MNVNDANKLKIENERLKKEIKEIENRVITTKNNLNDPLFSLSIQEFVNILESTLRKQSEQPQENTKDFTDKRYVYGIAGIASLFNCCRTTASRILSSGKIDAAVSRWGQKIIIDADMAIELNRQ